ncbi:acetylserotonin O-methyltransferase-like [Babylonia areolata]|uniref:acetylserotonin O-methyltransferase-like n=1 Tax=Babylonia areolata TaxID=304850 RepID=UPI003FD4EA9F
MEGNHNIRSDPHSDFVIGFMYGARKFKILIGALSLGIFDDIEAIGQGDWVPDSAVAKLRGFDLDNTRRLLNSLAAIKLLDRGTTLHPSGDDALYRNTIACSRYLLRNSPNSMVPLMYLEETVMPLFQKNLLYVLKNGSTEQFPRLLWKGGYPQDDAFLTLPDFAVSARLDYKNSKFCRHSKLQPAIPSRVGVDRELQQQEPPPGAMTLCPGPPVTKMQMVRELFLAAWDAQQSQCLAAIIDAFNLRGFSSIVDLGGGSGTLAWLIVQAHPHIYITVYDTPRVIDTISKPFSINQNIRYVKGDFFCDLLPEADCYILSHVLHEYDDEKVHIVLGRVFQHLNQGGSLIILEKILQDDKRAPATCVMDDVLLVTISRGRQRSEAEYRNLLEANGFKYLQVKRILGVNTFDVMMVKKPCQ